MSQLFVLTLLGVAVGLAASFTGLGGGFIMVPVLLFLGYSAQKSVGTSFAAILVIAISALVAHNKLANIDYRAGLALGLGGVVGAQIGARLLEQVSTAGFKRIFAFVLLALALYLLFKK
ncbi:MAG: sulfite exporter TauE/SafE family protein [Desulfohalobiaceae bacterium]